MCHFQTDMFDLLIFNSGLGQTLPEASLQRAVQQTVREIPVNALKNSMETHFGLFPWVPDKGLCIRVLPEKFNVTLLQYNSYKIYYK